MYTTVCHPALKMMQRDAASQLIMKSLKRLGSLENQRNMASSVAASLGVAQSVALRAQKSTLKSKLAERYAARGGRLP
jgi:hypothetical protein